jgi:hypothetical protein
MPLPLNLEPLVATMQYKSLTAIVSALVAGQATALSWTDAGSFSSPVNIDNNCSGSQKSGYDWSGLQPGFFSAYGSNTFAGFSYSDSFLEARCFEHAWFSDQMHYW